MFMFVLDRIMASSFHQWSRQQDNDMINASEENGTVSPQRLKINYLGPHQQASFQAFHLSVISNSSLWQDRHTLCHHLGPQLVLLSRESDTK